MKIEDKGNFTQIELETEAGQQNFRASLKDHDYRTWNREDECRELNKFFQDNNKLSQLVVKCGEDYVKIR